MEKFGYERLYVIGKGAFGAAVLVRSKKDGKKYVAKEINMLRMKKEEKEEAMHEIKVLSKLDHPNIVKYMTHFEVNGILYIVTEYADGGDLDTKIKNQRGVRFTESAILHYFVQVAMALKHLHDKKILHRDLKGQNIFLTSSNVVKLGDFGISTILLNTNAQARTMCGTPYYFSPELCQNKPYNNKSDIWSLGCVLYELTTLKHAFEGNNMKGLLQKIIRGVYPPVPSCYSTSLISLIDSMLQRNPSDRPSINTILRLPFVQAKMHEICSTPAPVPVSKATAPSAAAPAAAAAVPSKPAAAAVAPVPARVSPPLGAAAAAAKPSGAAPNPPRGVVPSSAAAQAAPSAQQAPAAAGAPHRVLINRENNNYHPPPPRGNALAPNQAPNQPPPPSAAAAAAALEMAAAQKKKEEAMRERLAREKERKEKEERELRQLHELARKERERELKEQQERLRILKEKERAAAVPPPVAAAIPSAFQKKPSAEKPSAPQEPKRVVSKEPVGNQHAPVKIRAETGLEKKKPTAAERNRIIAREQGWQDILVDENDEDKAKGVKDDDKRKASDPFEKAGGQKIGGGGGAGAKLQSPTKKAINPTDAARQVFLENKLAAQRNKQRYLHEIGEVPHAPNPADPMRRASSEGLIGVHSKAKDDEAPVVRPRRVGSGPPERGHPPVTSAWEIPKMAKIESNVPSDGKPARHVEFQDDRAKERQQTKEEEERVLKERAAMYWENRRIAEQNRRRLFNGEPSGAAPQSNQPDKPSAASGAHAPQPSQSVPTGLAGGGSDGRRPSPTSNSSSNSSPTSKGSGDSAPKQKASPPSTSPTEQPQSEQLFRVKSAPPSVPMPLSAAVADPTGAGARPRSPLLCVVDSEENGVTPSPGSPPRNELTPDDEEQEKARLEEYRVMQSTMQQMLSRLSSHDKDEEVDVEDRARGGGGRGSNGKKDDEDDDDFAEAEDKMANLVFLLAQCKVEGVHDTDPLMYRIELLRKFIEDNIGVGCFKQVYSLLGSITRFADEDAAQQKAQSLLGEDHEAFLPLITQLIFCEDEINIRANR